MTNNRPALHSGGCQCGAVRYALYAEPFDTHVCHCRMCQKAFGSLYAPLTKIAYADFEWTRGKPDMFASSADVERGFCGACGTPLTYAHLKSDYINFALGSLDRPEAVRPEVQIGIESRVAWAADIAALREQTTEDILSPDRLARAKSFQHPDHDTEIWPPERSR